MKSAVWLLLSLSGCDAIGIQPARKIGLAGEWDLPETLAEEPRECGSPTNFWYFPDGKYYYWGELGKWNLNGQTLTETATDYTIESDFPPDPPQLGRPFTTQLRWIDQNRFTKRYSDGTELIFRRCTETR